MICRLFKKLFKKKPIKKISGEMLRYGDTLPVFLKIQGTDGRYYVTCKLCRKSVWDMISIVTREGYFCSECHGYMI